MQTVVRNISRSSRSQFPSWPSIHLPHHTLISLDLQPPHSNMSVKEKPKITENKKGEQYTKISFKPDLVKFNLPAENGLAGDMEALLSKRVFDMAGTLKNVKVWLNEERLKITGFKKYVEMYTSGINEVRVL